MSAFSSFGRAIVRVAPLLAAVAFLLVVGWFGTRGQGPLGRVGFLREVGGLGPAPEDARDPRPSPDGTTPTTDGFYGIVEEPGMCMTWNQDVEITHRQSRRVVCEDPHLAEVAASFDLDGSAYAVDGPTDEDYGGVPALECDARIEAYLGHPLDPFGRFSRHMFYPFPDSWRAGDRTVVCAITAPGFGDPTRPSDELEELTGNVADLPQTKRLPIGACFSDRATRATQLVDCAEAHDFEALGMIDLDLAPGEPRPDTGRMYELTDEPCRALAEQVYGGPAGVEVGVEFLDVAATDWDAGERSVQCVMGQVGASGGWVPVIGPLRSAPAP